MYSSVLELYIGAVAIYCLILPSSQGPLLLDPENRTISSAANAAELIEITAEHTVLYFLFFQRRRTRCEHPSGGAHWILLLIHYVPVDTAP